MSQGLTHAFSAETYIPQILAKMAELLGLQQFAKRETPMDVNYHPELDTSPLLDSNSIAKIQVPNRQLELDIDFGKI